MKLFLAFVAVVCLIPAVVPCKSGTLMRSYVDKLQADNPQKCMQCPELNTTTICETLSPGKVDCGKAYATYSMIKTPGYCGRAFVHCNAQKKIPTAILSVEKNLFEKVPCSRDVAQPIVASTTTTSTTTTEATTTTTTTTTTTPAPTTTSTTTTTTTTAPAKPCNKYVLKQQVHYDVPKAKPKAKKPCKSAAGTTTTTAEPCLDDATTTTTTTAQPEFISLDNEDGEVEIDPTVEAFFDDRAKRSITDAKYDAYTFISKEASTITTTLTCNDQGQWEVTNNDGEIISGVQNVVCIVGAVGL